MSLLVILTAVCALYTIAGVAVKCIEKYERMKMQRARNYRINGRSSETQPSPPGPGPGFILTDKRASGRHF